MAIGDIIVGLDIGTSKVSCVVGQVNKFNEIEVIGYGLNSNSGVKKGIIVDPQVVAKNIQKVIEDAEDVSSLAINSSYINIKGMNVKLENLNITSQIEKPDDGLTLNDIQGAFSKIQIATKLENNEQIIDIIPYEYYVNGRTYKEEPIGAFAKEFSIKAQVIVAHEMFLDSLMKTLKLAGLKLDGLVLETLATSNIVLMPEEKNMGALLVDIGAGHTDISVYKDSRLEFYDTIPIGGDHITSDIALTFDINSEEAEKLKKQYNLAISAMITNNHDIKLNTVDLKDNPSIVKCSDVVKVIEARINEIYEVTKSIIEKNNLSKKIECIVLTGQGISNMVGAQELAILTFKINQVRICSPKLINVIKPQHTTVFGMVRYISGLSIGKHVNSDVEIVTDANMKEVVLDKIQSVKEGIKNIFLKLKKS